MLLDRNLSRMRSERFKYAWNVVTYFMLCSLEVRKGASRYRCFRLYCCTIYSDVNEPVQVWLSSTLYLAGERTLSLAFSLTSLIKTLQQDLVVIYLFQKLILLKNYLFC